ncbi:MAG: HAD-IIIA family hydrolase [Bacteroidales bacterium]
MKLKSEDINERAKKITLLLTDCDGVLTDSGVYYSSSGEAMKRFSLRDGMGVERLQKLVNVETGIITGENSKIVLTRVKKLKINEYHPESKNKYKVLKEILLRRELSLEQIAYMGDDVNDMEIMQHVGLSGAPADAMPMILDIAHIVTENKGGFGAFREFAEIIISNKQQSL